MRYLKRNVLLGVFGLLLLPVSGLHAEEDAAVTFVSFFEQSDQECEDRGGMRVFVKNDHDESMIDIQLNRYFYNVLQPDRSMFPLAAGQAQPLGCNRAFEVEQRWELVSARFITPQAAKERYGDYELFYRK